MYSNIQFTIECGECGTYLVGDNCFMRSTGNSNLCVQVGDRKDANGNPTRGAIGDTLHLAECRRDDSQRFNYFRRPTVTTRPSQPPTSLPPTSLPISVPTTRAPITTHSIDSRPPFHASTPTFSIPSPTPSVCHPNFEFVGVRVANSAVSWGAPEFREGVDLTANGDFNKRLEIRFEQTGSPKPFYVAK